MASQSQWVSHGLGALLLATTACSAPAAPPARPTEPAAPAPAAAGTAVPAAPTTAIATTADATFAAFAQRFLDGYLQRSPIEATGAGDHSHDGKWPDISVAGDAANRAWLEDMRAQLARLSHDGLSEQSQIDAAIVDDQLRFGIFDIDELKDFERSPLAYTGLISDGLDPLVTRDFGTKASRLASLLARLDGIPAIVAVAHQRLGHPSKIATETAIKQNKGLVSLVETELAPLFADLPGSADQLAGPAKAATAALHDFQHFLEAEVLPRSDGSFRLGRERFTRKLAFALGEDVDIEQVAADARALMVETQGEMVETAKQIWSDDKLGKLPPLATTEQRKAFVKQVLDHVAKDRPTNKTILADARRWLDRATAFVRERDLVTVPDEPIAVIEMPEYRRGVAVAYCDSSGPLEARPQTFFTISPTPSDWTKARAESFYREYNQAMLAELSIHEAMPGHYLQLMHNNKQTSKLRAVFASGPFVEGWAVYGEWLMAHNGFGGPRVKLEREKMVLRLTANAILDHDIHAGAMDEAAAFALMKGEAFQEDGEAAGKWNRARLSSAQLTTYFFGFSELLKLRRVAETKPGFTERGYHDRLLSWGSPAMKYVRQLLAKS